MRQILIAKASEKLGAPIEVLKAQAGVIIGPNGAKVSFGELVSADLLRVDAAADTKLKPPAAYHAIGKPFARVDIPAKVTGGNAYVQDMRPPGMGACPRRASAELQRQAHRLR